MNALKLKSIYASAYRWTFKNFGSGTLPQFKSLFNASFLLIMLLTNVMLFTQLLVKSKLVSLNSYTINFILVGAVMFMLINHFILLNNKWFKTLNYRLAHISKHNLNTWSVVLLINVIITCGLFIGTVR